MAWNLKGHWYEACSCKMNCRCTLGPAEPDQLWCSGFQLVEVESGQSDGVDLSGARLAFHAQLPGDFFSGIERARLYFDSSLNEAQRTELEAIYHGKRGGVWEGLNALIAEWLPSEVSRITVSRSGDEVTGAVEGVAEQHLAFLKTEDGRQAALVNAPVMAGFQVDTINLATANGTKVHDPDMRPWESLGFGGEIPFN
jgi:hypothetical protein